LFPNPNKSPYRNYKAVEFSYPLYMICSSNLFNKYGISSDILYSNFHLRILDQNLENIHRNTHIFHSTINIWFHIKYKYLNLDNLSIWIHIKNRFRIPRNDLISIWYKCYNLNIPSTHRYRDNSCNYFYLNNDLEDKC
jgi:hypothetical protein